MENIPFLIFSLLSINNAGLKGHNDFFSDYIDLNNTFSVKGIFVWIIFFRHYIQYYNRKSRYTYEKILSCFGQKIVSMFLFYSGYGIYESFKKKGNKYSKSLLIKSLIIFIKSELIILIFALKCIIYKDTITLKKYILAVFFYTSIGNSNWFAYTIILFYIYAFLSFVFIKNKKYNYLGIIFITILCFLHGNFTYFLYLKKLRFGVDNILPFILGIYYSGIRKYTDTYIMKYDFSYFAILSSFSLIFCYFYINKDISIFMHILMNGTFSIIVVLVNMKVKFDNEFLKFLNAHSYSIYLLQRIILSIFSKKKYLENYECMRILLQFSLIILISTTFDYSTSFIDKYFKRVDKRLEPKKHIDLVGESNRNIIIKKY